MIRYENFADPPCKELVDKLEAFKSWVNDPKNHTAPNSGDVASLYNLMGQEDSIKKELKEAYTKRVADRKEGTVNDYFLRLRQINDTANLLSAMYITSLSREKLLRITE